MELIDKQTAINTILGQPPEPHYPSWYAEQIKQLSPVQPDNQVHLCNSCSYIYPECPSMYNDMIFGNGRGNDNICACSKYLPPAQLKWISVEEKLPDEHDSIFKRFYGTNKWTDLMFQKRSDDVLVIEICDGEKQVGVAHTCDGKWRSNIPIINYEVIAWMPFPKLRSEDGRNVE